MAKSNEQLEDILDDLSVIKNNNVATEQRLGNIENLLAKLAAKEEVAPITPVASTSVASIPYDEIRKILGKRRKRKRVQTQRVSAKAKSARLNDH